MASRDAISNDAASEDASSNDDRGRPLLVAVDCGRTSNQPILFARDLAKRLGVPLVLVHVIDQRIEYLVPETQHQAVLQVHRAAALDKIETIMQEHLSGVDLEVVVEEGDPVSKILEIAQRHDAQFVVVGSRGPGRLSSALLGSTVAGLLHEADRPILAVPTHG